jgi:hypothetical protein
MWMGVPVLTLPGRSFASRVCASLVRAAGIEEMVCATPDAYVARAVALAQNSTTLAAIRQRLIAGRDSCRLFDTPALVRDLEKLYRAMWDDLEQGKLPAPDLRNLEAYHEAGIEYDLENIELLSDEAYHSQYRGKLADRHRLFPLSADSRLWSAPAQPADTPAQSTPRRVA